MHPYSTHDPAPASLVVEVHEVTIALAGALDDAGIRLPQLKATAERGADDWAVQLGDCNVRTGLALMNLVRDGLTLRQKYPEESVNASSEA